MLHDDDCTVSWRRLDNLVHSYFKMALGLFYKLFQRQMSLLTCLRSIDQNIIKLLKTINGVMITLSIIILMKFNLWLLY